MQTDYSMARPKRTLTAMLRGSHWPRVRLKGSLKRWLMGLQTPTGSLKSRMTAIRMPKGWLTVRLKLMLKGSIRPMYSPTGWHWGWHWG